MIANGAICTTSMNQVKTVHRVAARKTSGSAIMKRFRVSKIKSRSSLPSTGSGDGITGAPKLFSSNPDFESCQDVKEEEQNRAMSLL